VSFLISTNTIFAPRNTKGLAVMELGVDVARRGWLEKKDIINTFPLDRLLKRLKNKSSIIR
jgi:histidinol phosphatase-like PHP family hydrolase